MSRNTRSNKRIICLILALALILSMSGTVFAAPPSQLAQQPEMTERSIADIMIEFWRVGSTGAKSTVSATTYSIAEYIKSSITLQKYNVTSQTWSDVGAARVDTVYDTAVIMVSDTWTFETNTTYRLKVVMTDKTGSVITTVTAHSSSL